MTVTLVTSLCWWLNVGDNFKMLVTGFVILVTNILYLWTLASGTNIKKIVTNIEIFTNIQKNVTNIESPTFTCHQYLWSLLKFPSWTVSDWDSQSSNDLFWDETLFALGKVTFTLQNRHDLVFGRHSSELILEIKFLFRAFKFHLQTPSFQLQFCPSWWSCLCNECCKLYYIIYIKYVILYTAVDFGKEKRPTVWPGDLCRNRNYNLITPLDYKEEMRRSFEDTSEFNPLGTKLRLLFSVNSIASDPVLLGLLTWDLRCFSPRSGNLRAWVIRDEVCSSSNILYKVLYFGTWYFW